MQFSDLEITDESVDIEISGEVEVKLAGSVVYIDAVKLIDEWEHVTATVEAVEIPEDTLWDTILSMVKDPDYPLTMAEVVAGLKITAKDL